MSKDPWKVDLREQGWIWEDGRWWILDRFCVWSFDDNKETNPSHEAELVFESETQLRD